MYSTMKKHLLLKLFVLLLMLLALAACGGGRDEEEVSEGGGQPPTQTVIAPPTNTPQPAKTATNIPQPTATVVVIEVEVVVTATPTPTPVPTEIPQISISGCYPFQVDETPSIWTVNPFVGDVHTLITVSGEGHSIYPAKAYVNYVTVPAGSEIRRVYSASCTLEELEVFAKRIIEDLPVENKAGEEPEYDEVFIDNSGETCMVPGGQVWVKLRSPLLWNVEKNVDLLYNGEDVSFLTVRTEGGCSVATIPASCGINQFSTTLAAFSAWDNNAPLDRVGGIDSDVYQFYQGCFGNGS